MGFDTSGGGGEAGGGSIFDDPQFMQSLQGVMQQQPQGGGYEQDPWAGGGGEASQEQMYRRPRRKYMGGGGEADFGDPRRAQGGGVVSAPDGSVYGGGASSPFEVGPSSGAPNALHAAQQPSGGGYGRFPWMDGSGGGGGDPNDPNSYEYMRSHPPSFPMDTGPGSANEAAQRAWSQKLEQARLRGGGGGRSAFGTGGGGGWYGGYGNNRGGGQQQWYRPQPQGQMRPDSSNPGAAYDAGPGKMEAQQQSLRDQGAQQGAPPRWQMPQGGAYGRPQQMRRRRFYGNSGAIQGPQASGGGAPVGGGY